MDRWCIFVSRGISSWQRCCEILEEPVKWRGIHSWRVLGWRQYSNTGRYERMWLIWHTIYITFTCWGGYVELEYHGRVCVQLVTWQIRALAESSSLICLWGLPFWGYSTVTYYPSDSESATGGSDSSSSCHRYDSGTCFGVPCPSSLCFNLLCWLSLRCNSNTHCCSTDAYLSFELYKK